MMSSDEVYQAAMEAGQGGIRWNSTNNRIQIMDQNKNWVNWQYYNPNKSIQHMASNSIWGSATSYTLSCPYQGYYFVFAVTNSNQGSNITSTGSMEFFVSKSYSKFAIVRANANDTIYAYSNGQGTGPNGVAIYYASNVNSFSNATTTETVVGANNTFGYKNGNSNCIFGASAVCTGYSLDFSGDNYDLKNYGSSNSQIISIIALPDSTDASITFNNGTSIIGYCTVS